MDLSPKLLTDIEFREQWRGYNPSEVDEFLERVAAGVGELQQRLAEALERAGNAERRLLDRSDEDEIRRTLVLAQRTAVSAMEEARTEADRLVSETEARCRQMIADAEAQDARLDAELSSRRRAELGDLAEQRAALQLDIDHLRAYVEEERAKLAAGLRGQLEWIESGYSMAPPPTVSDIQPPSAHVPEPAPFPAREPEPVSPAAPALEDGLGPEDEIDAAGSAVDDLRQAREELADALRRAGVEAEAGESPPAPVDVPPAVAPTAVADEEPPLLVKPAQPRPALFDDRAGDRTGTYDVLGDAAEDEPVDDDLSVPTPQWRDDEDDDPFLAELRRAVVDTEPLGPRDHHHASQGAVDDDDGDDASSAGFFRRGKKRG